MNALLPPGRALSPVPRAWQTVTSLLVVAALSFADLASAAAPLAGSTIGNQASATYTDASNTSHTATSNVVLTVVQQVASLTLSSSQSKAVSPGGQVVFPHTLSNTGNGADTFALSLAQLGSDNFDLANATIYADANGDGLPDSSTPISSTGLLPVGSKFSFVVVGTVPSGQTSAQTSQVRITAASTFTPAVTTANTDTATVSNNAVVLVTESLSASSGASPSGPYTYTVTFTNTGNVAASALTLANSLPSGMVYEAGTARWSGSASPLTDALAGDPAGIAFDYSLTQAGRLTAVISSLAPGQSGTLTFQAKVPAGVAPGNLTNNTGFTYNDGASVVGPYTSNTVVFTVTQPPAVTMTGSTVSASTQGGYVNFPNVVTNTGYGTETFEITTNTNLFPAGTSIQLMKPDGATALLDSNGNGTPDTGPLAPGATYTVILRATLPPSATGGPYSIKKVATAASDPTVSATTTDTLTSITSNTTDLMADAAGTLGAGVGPEVNAVATLAADPSSTVRFTLNVKNSGSTADTYNLDASSLADFSVAGLPTGWSVVFRDANGAIVTKTSVINVGSNQVLYADVTVPAGQAPGTQPVYFRALSTVTGSADRLHDAVTVNTLRGLSLTPNHSGQVYPGGTVLYTHTLVNTGNVTEGNGSVSTVSLVPADNIGGWNSIVYYDANGNGTIDPGEVPVTDTSFVSNGAAGLAPGESVKLIVKVFAGAGAVVGSVDTTTLTATTTNGSAITTVPAVAAVTDSSTVILGELTLLKEQALDANADGVADTTYTTANLGAGAVPGACIRYRITVTNTGSQPVLAVVVNDVTPTYTTYHGTVAAATSAGSVGSAPAAGVAGALSFNVGTLAAGASAVVTFGVQINP